MATLSEHKTLARVTRGIPRSRPPLSRGVAVFLDPINVSLVPEEVGHDVI